MLKVRHFKEIKIFWKTFRQYRKVLEESRQQK